MAENILQCAYLILQLLDALGALLLFGIQLLKQFLDLALGCCIFSDQRIARKKLRLILILGKLGIKHLILLATVRW